MQHNRAPDANDTSCSIKVKSFYPNLRDSEKKVADYILSNVNDILAKPLLEVSNEIGVSEASIIRFCKQLGYSGYSELKLMLAKDVGERSRSEFSEDYDINITENDQLSDIPHKVVARTIQALEDTVKIFNQDEFIKAVQAIISADKIDFYGVANSASIADDAMNKFIRLGIRCSVFSDAHLQMMSAVNLGEKSVAIGISHSGKTKDTIDALREAKRSGATTICITNYKASLITEVSDIKLLTASYETGFFSETMVSRIAQLVIVDMLYMGVILQDFDRNMFKLSNINNALSGKAY